MTDPDNNIFTIFDYENWLEDTMPKKNFGAVFREYTLDLGKGTSKYEDLMVAKNGQLDMPQVNPHYRWQKKNCYTWLT